MSFFLLVWKWAANDAPGRTDEVVKALGETSPPESLAWFDVHRFLDSLQPFFGDLASEHCPFVVDWAENRERPAAWIHFDIAWSAAGRVPQQLARFCHVGGLVAFDPQSMRTIEPCCPKAIPLEVEGRPPVYDPTLAEIVSSLGELNSKDPSFAILANSDGSYVQCAGSTAELTVEWRHNSEGDFAHYVAGSHIPSPRSLKIHSSGGCVTVKRHQVLILEDALENFLSFWEASTSDSILNLERRDREVHMMLPRHRLNARRTP